MDLESDGNVDETSIVDPPIRTFMSYRRLDSRHFSGRFYDKLVASFGDSNVFRDIDSIRPGSDFVKVITATLRDVDAVIVLIGPEWAGRLQDPSDFVRLEVSEALRLDQPVIPVLIEDTQLPYRSELPEELLPILGLNAVQVRSDPDFHRDAERVIAGLRGAVKAARSEAARRAAAEADRRRQEEQRAADERRRAEEAAAIAAAAREAEERRQRAAALEAEEAQRRAELEGFENRRIAEHRARLAAIEHERELLARSDDLALRVGEPVEVELPHPESVQPDTASTSDAGPKPSDDATSPTAGESTGEAVEREDSTGRLVAGTERDEPEPLIADVLDVQGPNDHDRSALREPWIWVLATVGVLLVGLVVLVAILGPSNEGANEPAADEPTADEPAADEPTGDEPAANPEGRTIRIAIVAPTASDDFAITQSMVDSVNRVGETRDIDVNITDGVFIVEDAAAALRGYAENGFDLVIAHGSQYGAPLQEIAPDFPEVSFAWGIAADTFGIPNVYAYTVRADQGGYVNGTIAAQLTESNMLGVVGPIEIGDAKLYVDGFVAGVAAQNPEATVNVNYIESFVDVAFASEAANAHVSNGADVLTGIAPLVVGVIGVADEAGIPWFGTQSNQTALGEEIVVSSQVYHWEVLLEQMLDNIDAGILGGEVFAATLSNGGLVMEFNDAFDLDDEIQLVAVNTVAAIASGRLSTGVE